MENTSLTRFWTLIYSTLREIWQITEPRIEDAAVRLKVPIELYYYSEHGLETFSIEEFQKRDPFTNPELFERQFVRLDVQGWIEPLSDGKYRVTEKTLATVRKIIEEGDGQLSNFVAADGLDLPRLAGFLKQISLANKVESEPPAKWAISHRFRVMEKDSLPIVKIRERLMDIFAYRDDSHLAAARPHFNEAGIVWLVLGSLIEAGTVTAGQVAEALEFRGYEASDYEIALQAAVGVGWAEETGIPGTYRPTRQGRDLHEQVDKLTDEYFFRPWSVMTVEELEELFVQLTKLHDQLIIYKKTNSSDSRF